MLDLVQHAEAIAKPWADFYSDSAWAKTIVVFLHLGGMLAAGGFAVSADRATLRLGRLDEGERLAFIRELGDLHRPVLVGLVVVVVSGLAMLFGDLETLLPSITFWVKMAAFVLLLLNGLTLQRAERRCSVEGGAGAWRALHRSALRSATLWFAVVFLGAMLASS